ncbi:hypothetical protein BJY01DRAFT_222012 [Aspergillus pseudoustus]|uniref:Uncharacterized protein n=1 Tax=Aspergillus pseudoustus TaxID=1810923 RepID=A0ABR4J8U2_9EURO
MSWRWLIRRDMADLRLDFGPVVLRARAVAAFAAGYGVLRRGESLLVKSFPSWTIDWPSDADDAFGDDGWRLLRSLDAFFLEGGISSPAAAGTRFGMSVLGFTSSED